MAIHAHWLVGIRLPFRWVRVVAGLDLRHWGKIGSYWPRAKCLPGHLRHRLSQHLVIGRLVAKVR